MSFHDRDLALERPQRLIRPARPQGLIRAEPLARPGPRLVARRVIVRDPAMMLPGLIAPGMGRGLSGLPTIVQESVDYWDTTDPLWPASIDQAGAEGFLSIWVAFNASSTTVPTVPAGIGWSSLGTKQGTSSAMVVASRIVPSSSNIGTWTNASLLIGSYFINVSTTGAIAFTSSAATTSVGYPALTLTYGGVGGSWIVTGGASNTRVDWVYRSGQTNRLQANYTAVGSAGIADNGGRTTSNLSSTNVTFPSTMSRVITFALELY